MKNSLPRILAYLLILTTLVDCSKRDLDEPAPNLANCRVSREVVKIPYYGPAGEDSEVVSINGQSFTVSTYTRTKFIYDARGRVVREDNERRPEFWTTYFYSPTAIVKTIRANSPTGSLENFSTTIPLNGQDLDGTKQYDAQGYPLDSVYADGRPTNKRLNGNLVEEWIYNDAITIKVLSQYDKTRSAIPDKYPFSGRKNHNLESSSVAETTGGFYGRGELYRTNTSYKFDRYGRVSRRVYYFRLVYKGFMPYFLSSERVEVTDFEYDCS